MSGLANKVAPITGVRVASAQRSPSVWPQIEQTWPLRTIERGGRKGIAIQADATNAVAATLGPRGIRVNAVAPGVVDTGMWNLTKTEAHREVTLGMQASKRIGKPEDIADGVAFLASDGARWIRGASIPVDGGSKRSLVL